MPKMTPNKQRKGEGRMIAAAVLIVLGVTASVAAGIHEPRSDWGAVWRDFVFVTGVGSMWFGIVALALAVQS